MGGSITTTVARDEASVSGAFLARDIGPGIDLLADAVANPRFPDTELRAAQLRVLSSAFQRGVDPASAADDATWATVFRDLPYGRPTSGTLSSISQVTVARIRDFYRTHYTPDRAVLVVAGDVRADD